MCDSECCVLQVEQDMALGTDALGDPVTDPLRDMMPCLFDRNIQWVADQGNELSPLYLAVILSFVLYIWPCDWFHFRVYDKMRLLMLYIIYKQGDKCVLCERVHYLWRLCTYRVLPSQYVCG